jgi:hypothetical protein
MLETATIMGQPDRGVTRKHYARLFDRSDVEARVRAPQASLDYGSEAESGMNRRPASLGPLSTTSRR